MFVPTNEAFAALPAKFDSELKYHVVSGAVHAADLSDGQIIKLKATVNNIGVFINNAQVTTANVAASNGTVHIINAGLLQGKSLL